MRNKKGELNTGMIVILVMGIIVALALIPEIFNQQAVQTTKINVADEVVDIGDALLGDQLNASVDLGPVTSYPTGWKVTGCPLENIVVTNATGSALTVTTDYTLSTTTGILNLKNTTTTQASFKATNNNSLIDYTYCPDGYNTDGGSRSIAGLIGLFAVLSLVAFVIGYGVKDWLENR